jgi:hypothetical protein
METLTEQFKTRVGAFLVHTGMPPTTFGMKAVGDPNLMRQIEEGRSVTLRLADQALAFIDEYGRPVARSRLPIPPSQPGFRPAGVLDRRVGGGLQRLRDNMGQL